jgi:hypothetical protein
MGKDLLTPAEPVVPKSDKDEPALAAAANCISEINWSDERKGGRLMCNTQPATVVYTNPHDQVVIRQEAACGRCDEDSFVFFSQAVLPELIAELACHLPQAAGDAVRDALIHNDLLQHKF